MIQHNYNSGVNRDFPQNKEKKEKSRLHKECGACFTSNRQDWETPPALFKELDDEFHFVLDSAATEENKLCKYFYTSKDDGLAKSWNQEGGGAVFCNPPYGKKIIEWVAKGATEAATHNITVVMLIPAKPDIKSFHKYIWDKTKGEFRPKVEVRFIEGRLTFYLNGKREKDPAAFPSMIVVFNGKNGKARARPDLRFAPRGETKEIESEPKQDHSISNETKNLETKAVPTDFLGFDEDGNITSQSLGDLK